MLEALGWGSLAAGSLVLGTLLSFARHWSRRQIGIVLAFGAGALISAVSFELVEEGVQVGGLGWTALGLGTGAVTYYVLDGIVERRAAGAETGGALALAAFLDGVPEQLVLGISLAAGDGVGIGLLAAIFVSNLPEATGSAHDMEASGTSRGKILALWTGVALACAASTVVGFALADAASSGVRAGIDGFAAGALLVMLVDDMIPEARTTAGRTAGLVTVLGFAVALALSAVS